MIFDKWFGKSNEEKAVLDQQSREHNFMRERDSFMAGSAEDPYMISLRAEKSDLTRWQQDLDETLESLKHELLSEVYTEGGWKPELISVGIDEENNPVYEIIRPMVNRHGVYKIITVVKRYMNRNFMMSNFDEDTIFRILRRLKVDLVLNLGSLHEEYEIRPEDLSIIVRISMDCVEATLYRALGNGERKYLNTINKRVEAYSETSNAMQQKKSLFGGSKW